MTDLEKTTLKSKKEAEQIQDADWQQLADAQAMATPEAQKDLTEEEVSPDVHPEEKKPVAESDLSSTSKKKSEGTF